MKKISLLVLLLIGSIQAFACKCSKVSLADAFKQSEFVATAKILSVTPNKENEQYHDIEVELINVYKGEKITKLKIYSAQRSSCAFYTEENSTWLIFANKKDGILTFGYCSASLQIDRKFNLIEYPNLDVTYKSTIDLKLSVLDWLKRSEISLKDEFTLKVVRATDCYQLLKGFDGKTKDFAVVSFEINMDLSVGQIKLVKKFDNKKLSRAFLRCAKGDIKVSHQTLQTLPNKTTLYAIYYFYPSEANEKSFVTHYDL